MTNASTRAPFQARLGQYLMERFRPGTNGLAAMVLAASLSFSYAGATRSSPPLDLSLAATIVLIVGMFFVLRVCDEFKDADDDARYRPSRPVPRGLISLPELRNAAVAVGALQAFVLLVQAPGLWVLLVATWGWIVLMTFEFGVGPWLKRHPVVYLVSHMLVMPFIAMLAMGVSSGSLDVLVDPAAWALAGIAFVCGLTMEIGRKIWDEEIEGVETYSRSWGRARAQAIWAGIVGLLVASLWLYDWIFVDRLASALLLVPFLLAQMWVVVSSRDAGMPAPVIERVSILFVLAAQIQMGIGPWLP